MGYCQRIKCGHFVVSNCITKSSQNCVMSCKISAFYPFCFLSMLQVFGIF